jgi:hypothetical protein
MTNQVVSDAGHCESKSLRIFFSIATSIGYGLAIFLLLGGVLIAIQTKNIGMFFLYLFAGLFAFAFPMWVAARSRKRNRKGWAIATVLTTFLGLGWLIGTVAYFQRPNYNESEIEVPCPECHYTKGYKEITTLDQKTGKPTLTLEKAILWGLLALITIGGGIGMAILIWVEGDEGIIQFTYGSIIAGIAILAMGIGIGRFGVMGVMEYIKADRIKTTTYICGKCGHKWNNLPI